MGKVTYLHRIVKTMQNGKHGRRMYVDTHQVVELHDEDVSGHLIDINYRLREKFVEISEQEFVKILNSSLTNVGTTLVNSHFVSQYAKL